MPTPNCKTGAGIEPSGSLLLIPLGAIGPLRALRVVRVLDALSAPSALGASSALSFLIA